MIKRVIRNFISAATIVVSFLICYAVVNRSIYKVIPCPFTDVKSEEIVKSAIKKRDIKGGDYIICKWTAVTGYNYVNAGKKRP